MTTVQMCVPERGPVKDHKLDSGDKTVTNMPWLLLSHRLQFQSVSKNNFVRFRGPKSLSLKGVMSGIELTSGMNVQAGAD